MIRALAVHRAMSADLSRDLDQHRGYLLRVARLHAP
jgi:hypothetical protein